MTNSNLACIRTNADFDAINNIGRHVYVFEGPLHCLIYCEKKDQRHIMKCLRYQGWELSSIIIHSPRGKDQDLD